VDGYNGKLAVHGGITDQPGVNNGDDTRAVGLFDGSFSVPLSHRYGAQVDFTAGTVDGFLAIGAGGHVFRRNPEVGLIGVIGHWVHLRGANAHRVGAEGEYYMGRWTAAGNVGWQWGNDSRRGLLIVPEGIFAEASVSFYPVDDLMVRAGLGLAPIPGDNYHFKFVGAAEWQFARQSVPGLTAFVDGSVANHDSYIVTAGLRWYFRLSGDRDKSLIRRHREDDPQSLNPANLFDGFTGGNPRVKKEEPPVCPDGGVLIDGQCVFPE
jgi:hypothetical protein